MRITGFETNDEMLKEVGARIKRCRLAAPLTQGALARKAGVSPRTIVNIEAGKGATLDSIISVLRVLSLAGNVEALVPDQGVRPSDLAKLKKERRRAPRNSEKSSNYQESSWGDVATESWDDLAGWTWGEDA